MALQIERRPELLSALDDAPVVLLGRLAPLVARLRKADVQVADLFELRVAAEGSQEAKLVGLLDGPDLPYSN